MKMLLASFVAVAVVAVAAWDSPAQYPGQPCYPPRVAPDMCGSYFYCTNGCTWYGPSYNVNPPFPPYGGIPPGSMPNANGGGPPNMVSYNPYVRSPRDFFMWTEAQKERHTRETRPPFIPY